MRILPVFFFLCLLLAPAPPLFAHQFSLDLYQPAVERVYSGQESMHFSISWSGGVKIGDLYLSVRPQEQGRGLAITARVTDYGLFHLFYPVNDTFTTLVQGDYFLPYRYDIHQVEGSSMDVRRLSLYDQKGFFVRYRKNSNPEKVYSLDGPVYNEFSAFYITRVLHFALSNTPIVPTFADEKRHPVKVRVLAREKRHTFFGTINTIKVMPVMDFKGLYDKDGDTVFWLSDDQCRVPVEVRSKILIGSLVGKLIEYSNPACHLRKSSSKAVRIPEDDLL